MVACEQQVHDLFMRIAELDPPKARSHFCFFLFFFATIFFFLLLLSSSLCISLKLFPLLLQLLTLPCFPPCLIRSLPNFVLIEGCPKPVQNYWHAYRANPPAGWCGRCRLFSRARLCGPRQNQTPALILSSFYFVIRRDQNNVFERVNISMISW